MAVGLLTCRENDQIRLLEVVGASSGFQADGICRLRESYCGETLLSGRPLGIDHAGASEWRDHPAYRFIKMESYLGSPIRIGGEMCGTLCLLDPEPREEPFTARDFEKLRLLVERVEAILAFHEEEVRLDGVLQRLSATRGQDFFGTFAQSLAQALEVRHVFIGEFVDDRNCRLRSVAWWDESKLGKQFEYDLAGSPCENLAAGEFFRCAAGIRNLFPNDQLVRRFFGESYLGIPIVAEDECLVP